MIRTQSYSSRSGIIKMRECDSVLCSNRMPHNNFIDIVELIPVFVEVSQIAIQRFEFWTTRDGYVECLGGKERFQVKEIVVVFVKNVREYLICQSMQIGHHVQWQVPFSVWGTVDIFSMFERLMIIKPIIDSIILLWVEFHIDRLKRLHLKNVIAIVQRYLLIIKGRKSHSLEMPSISFLSSHHYPHSTPLCCIDWLDDFRNFVDEADCARDMIQYFDISDLLPRHGNVFEELIHRVGGVFQSTQKHSFVSSKLPAWEISMIFDNFSENLRRQCFFLRFNKAMFFLFRIFFVVELPPPPRFLIKHLLPRRHCLLILLLMHNSYKL